jgi:hypothetical protein
MIRVTKDTIIYILCPGNVVTGGTEALHELRYYLDMSGYRACLSYYDGCSSPSEKYLKYNPLLVPLEAIEDAPHHVLIVPEIVTHLLGHYIRITKCIWWLSLSFYDGGDIVFNDGIIRRVKKTILRSAPFLHKLQSVFRKKLYPGRKMPIRYYMNRTDFYLCNSKFTYDYVKTRSENVKMFVQPLGLDFLRLDTPELSSVHRIDTIPYNPARPSAIMQKLLQREDLQFVPIKGLGVSEVIELFRKSKLYIDFGLFGGPERLPKESVLNGTMLLVGRRNAAKNEFDVAIPEQFKIEDWDNEQEVVGKIKWMLEHYDELIDEFEFFRKKIAGLEESFIRTIKDVFIIEEP